MSFLKAVLVLSLSLPAGAVEFAAQAVPEPVSALSPLQAALPPSASLALPVAPAVAANGTVAFMTDFGVKDPAVGICKLAIARVSKALTVIDLSHLIPPFNVGLGSDFLAAAAQQAEPGTTFVAVVDPGVGGARKSVAIRTKTGHLLVGPDNGLFAKTVAEHGLDTAVEITNQAYFHKPGVSSTFHGRDIYAPVGAHLASGVPIEALGPKLESIAPLDAPQPRLEKEEVHGVASYVEDPFGSVLTNIPRKLVEEAGWKPRQGLVLELQIGNKTVRLPYEKTFSDVAKGAALALIHSREVLSFSLNQGHFGNKFEVAEGQTVVVRKANP